MISLSWANFLYIPWDVSPRGPFEGRVYLGLTCASRSRRTRAHLDSGEGLRGLLIAKIKNYRRFHSGIESCFVLSADVQRLGQL